MSVIQKSYLVGTNRTFFRVGKPAEIMGVKYVGSRHCFLVRFEDGNEYCVALENRDQYEIISEEDVRTGKIPSVR